MSLLSAGLQLTYESLAREQHYAACLLPQVWPFVGHAELMDASGVLAKLCCTSLQLWISER